MNHTIKKKAIEAEVDRLTRIKDSLMEDEDVLWDEINAVQRDINYLKGKLETI